MRLVLLLSICVLLVACSPREASEKLLEKSGFDATGHVVDGAFENPDSCTEDLDCSVGRICVNQTCQPKPVS